MMSHNQPSDTDLRPDPGPYGAADRRRPSADFYRPHQESFSSSYPSSSSSLSCGGSATPAACPQDGVFSILSSCGLQPGDLSLLAELPEDVLPVESLPRILQQIKGRRGPGKPPFPPSSYHHSSARRPAGSSSSTDWDRLRGQPVQNPLNCWGSPRTGSSARPSSSSSGYVDFPRRPGPSQYGKAGPAPFQDRPSFNPAARGKRSRTSRFSDRGPANHRAIPPPNESQWGRNEVGSSSSRAAASTPSNKQALDFHGTPPTVFPYSCSLCEITVLSDKVWTQHINGTQHADGQLCLLQQCPDWDCRMETVSRDNNQSETRKAEGRPPPPHPANQNQTSQQKKKLEKGKVVCVKFPAQSVDETYLRKLSEPFGRIVKILMFPSLAFVELGSVDQAKDLVKFHVNYPPTVNGEQMDFSLSNTFNFLQSSRVVSFSPAPAGEDGQSDLMSIVKRFGPPLYTLFLPSMVFVEMKNVPDAQKLVDYYFSNKLRINEEVKVSFSREYSTLMRVPSAKRYGEEPAPTETTRTASKDRAGSRSGSRDKSSREIRSGSRDKPSRTDSEEEPVPLRESKPEEQTEENAESSAEDSDIEGMEVIAEDGENLEVEEDEEAAAERTPEQDEEEVKKEEVKKEEVKDGVTEEEKPLMEEEEDKESAETAETELQEIEEDTDFPINLENCIALDELGDDEWEEPGEKVTDEPEGFRKMLSSSEAVKDSRETPEEEEESGIVKTLEKEPTEDKELDKKRTPEKETYQTSEKKRLKRRSCEDESVPPKTLKTEETSGRRREAADRSDQKPSDERRDEKWTEVSLEAEPESADPGGPRKPPGPQRSEEAEQQTGPAGGAAGAETPPKPVEFVRPVVGYFCNLCQLIFVDEDEAKQQHCSSPTHYSRYQVAMATSSLPPPPVDR
ncbi:matrin-3-like isoform X2 [Embiotoca jacksoni]|uniref:matrin-3-like isoform X2 n=1 Tax=Embiotoca jacksoni TaxID=100190 RepID=UPI003704016F